MPNTKKGELNSAEKKITLSGLLSVVDPETQTLIIHHMGADCYEAVYSGFVREAMSSRCVEVCGDRPVEKVAVDVDDWPDTPTPVLIITIGEKAVKK